MRYMLDTDICSYVIRARDPKLLAIMQQKADSGADISISAVSYAELRFGAVRSLSAGRYNHAIRLFCDRLNSILAWDQTVADEFATLQGKLFRIGKPLGRNDTLLFCHLQKSCAIRLAILLGIPLI